MTFWIAIGLLALATTAALVLAVRRAGGRSTLGIIVALAVPGIALATYDYLGAPDLPDQPYAARTDTTERGAMQSLLGELTRRLEADPQRLDGWLLLARARLKIGDYREAADAFARARKLAPDNGEIAGELGEALIHAADGAVGEDARAALTFAVQKNPRDPKALFYLGHDARTRDDYASAIQFWTDLIAVSPADASWIADLRGRIAEAAEAGKIDLATIKPSVAPLPSAPTPAAQAPGPGADDMAAAAQMAPEDRAAFIRSMVERLAARLEDEPDDLDGWRRLARAWRVLGETQKADAADAKIKALEAKPAKP